MTSVLLSTTYFGPVQWYQKLYRADQVWLEQYEHFQKQTYRNRCVIAGPNGPQALVFPVERADLIAGQTSAGQTVPSLISSLRISDHGDWRRQHWNALATAYGDSPFFEYYEDDLRPFFTEKNWEYLFEFNFSICAKICDLVDIFPHVSLTTAYAREAPAGMRDFRETIRPKHPVADPDFVPRPYYQVYGQRHGFLPNLSILDLLFNMGPESILYL